MGAAITRMLFTSACAFGMCVGHVTVVDGFDVFCCTAIQTDAVTTVTLEQHIQNAQVAINSKRYKDAERELKAALKIDKTSAKANLFLAVIYHHLNKSKDAIKRLDEAVKLQPNYPDAHYLCALIVFERGDLVRAGREIDLALDQGARFPNAYVLKGDLSLATSAMESALQSYEEALRLGGENYSDAAVLRERAGGIRNYIEFRKRLPGASYVRPVALNSPMPRYTEEARQNKVQGSVKVLVFISEGGVVASMLIISRLGYGLDAEAVRAASTLRFKPATKDGKPVPFWMNVLIEFNLR